MHLRHLLGYGLLCAVFLYQLHIEISSIYYCVTAVSVGSVMSGENTGCLLLWQYFSRIETVLWLLCHPEKNKCVCSSHGSSYFVPAFSSHLGYHVFSEQCEQ